MAGTVEQTRMFALECTLRIMGRVENIIRSEDVVEYAATLEEYLKNGKKKPGLERVNGG